MTERPYNILVQINDMTPLRLVLHYGACISPCLELRLVRCCVYDCEWIFEYKMAIIVPGLSAQYDSGETSYRDSRCKGDKRYPSRLCVGVSLRARALCGWITMPATGRGLISVWLWPAPVHKTWLCRELQGVYAYWFITFVAILEIIINFITYNRRWISKGYKSSKLNEKSL
jgi:hypothetical protein